MTTLREVSLDDQWHYSYFLAAPAGDIVDSYSGVLRSITDWHSSKFPQAIVWMRRTFTLEPTAFCVRYYLQIASMPPAAVITINDYTINLPTTPAPYMLDVTDHVKLEDNVIAFRVTGVDGGFGHVCLLPIACDEL
jgi:hypothetical protein